MPMVPFTISNAFEGIAEVNGLARFADDVLVLEFQTKDSFFGLIKSGVREVELPIADIVAATYKKTLVGAHLQIQAAGMKALSVLPGNKGAEVRLKIARKHRPAAQELASTLRLRLSELKLQALDGRLQDRGA